MSEKPIQPDGPERGVPDDAPLPLSRAEADRLASGLTALYAGSPGASIAGVVGQAGANTAQPPPTSLTSALDARMRDLIAKQTTEPRSAEVPEVPAIRLAGTERAGDETSNGRRSLRFPRWIPGVAAAAAIVAIGAIVIPWSTPPATGLAGSTVAKAKSEAERRVVPRDGSGVPSTGESGATASGIGETMNEPANADGALSKNTFIVMPGAAPAGASAPPAAPVARWSTLDNAAAAESLRDELRSGRTDIVTAQRLSVLLARGVSLTRADLAPALESDVDASLRKEAKRDDVASAVTRDDVRALAQRSVRLSLPVDSRGARADEPAFWLIDFELAGASTLEAHQELSPLDGEAIDPRLDLPDTRGGLRWISEDPQ